MNVVIIEYNAGNVQSVLYSMQRLGINAIVTGDPEKISNADKVIFPGVGNASSAMEYLKSRNLDKLIISLKQPVLGICLGLQLLCNYSEEGDTSCLGIFDASVKRFRENIFPAKNEHFKIPHIGWNNVYNLSSPLLNGIMENSFVYYVHSYYAEIANETIAITDYIHPFSAAMQKDNFYGVQFHAEKSASAGEKIISNFLNIS